MKKLILLGLILIIVPFVMGDEAWEFHMDNGTFLVNSSNLYDTKFCTYSGSYGLLCNSNATGGSLSLDGYYNSPDNETDPIYSAWDKSTGITINESQISDLKSYYYQESDLTTLLDDDYHETGENLVVGNYDLILGGGFGGGGITLYDEGNAFFANDLFIGGDILTVNVQAINGSFLPNITNTYDLGSDTYQWKDAYFDGTLEADAITLGGTALGTLYYSSSNPNSYITDGNTNWDNSYGFVTTNVINGYFNSETNLTTLLDDNYEVQLNNEAGLYAVLSDVTQFYESGDKVGDADTLDTHDSSYFQVALTNEASLYSALSDVTSFLETDDVAQLQSLTITEDEGTGATLDTAMTFDNAVISQNSTHFCIVGSGSGGTLCVESN